MQRFAGRFVHVGRVSDLRLTAHADSFVVSSARYGVALEETVLGRKGRSDALISS
jgi:hypothetical protein